MSLSSPTSKDDTASLIFVPRSSSSSLGSLWLLCLLAAPFRSPISASQSKPPPHHCTFPPLSIQGAARGRVRSRPMRVQRGCQPTNQEPASWDAPAELAARHHFEKELAVPGCRLLTVEEEKSSLGSTNISIRQRPAFSCSPPPQCILARSFKGPFWPSKGFPIQLCIWQILFAALHSTATSAAELCWISELGPGRILPLANYLDLCLLPPLTLTKLQACF